MSYNQTYGKINKSEEVEKGRFNLDKAEKQIGEAMRIIMKQAKNLNEAQSELRKASNKVDGAGNLVDVLQMSGLVAPKRSRSTDSKDARAMARDLHQTAKDLEKLDESIPFFDAMDYNVELAHLLTRMKEFNKRNR
tara:strand:+ start:388 stop:795 length:408 start_codon:yes stop_codon:yes gene_type:complete